MKEILIISGKGGTGKTFFTGCLATSLNNKILVDCDVDAANLHLLLHPEIKQTYDFIGGKIASIDETRCIQCGACKEVCKFNAINDRFQVEDFSCEGCTICSYVCPEKAIILKDRISGKYFLSETKYGILIHARLGIAQENSGKLVTKLREIAKETAQSEGADYIVIDGPPGVGCPVMASMTGVDLVVAVTEPTVSGMHDLSRVIELSKHFNIPVKVVINKYDLNTEMSSDIVKMVESSGIEVCGKIPFSEDILASVKAGKPFLEFTKNSLTIEIEELIDKIT
ncbi:MinD superfamily P-loop ATPase [Thermodesulfovibrio aggregans]|uniref:MinD superfamily P-loop ATPase n=1 Tax=Thermodesulfovibrio aggregans TaxID=86166 RepID=A0A0U9HMI5_9BACT|nr:ATP-binding protein [Thermodesulfovibrio aggregans]GAQ94268.1 MinD superfamily P-loop ATPase [Thermodesulfovibrio aggregans]